MPPVNARPLLRLAVVCAALIAIAYVLFGRGGGAEQTTVDADATEAAPTTQPFPFGPVPDSGAGVVQTASGLVLPVTGGEEGTWEVLTPCANQATLAGERIRGAHIVLDPGHGGFETGAVGPSGVVEAEINLDVARLAKDRLEELGATVVLTRTADTRVTVTTRAAIARALDPLAFVSIHHNGGPTTASDEPGVLVFTQDGVAEATRLGGVLFEELQAGVAPLSDTWSAGNAVGVRARLGADGDDYYGVLREAVDVPAVLLEALYLSSEPEALLLLEPAIREAEAQAIADGIVAWLETDRPGSRFLPTLEATETAGGGGGTAGCEDPLELVGTGG